MNPEHDPHNIGGQLGENGVNSMVAEVEQFCAYKVLHIELEGRAPIAILKAEYTLLARKADAIEAQLRDAPPPSDMRHHRRRKIFAWTVTGILTVTAFFLAVMTLAPFRLGWLSYVLCLGIATVIPFLMEELFEGGKLDFLAKPLTIIALAAGMTGAMLLAHVRGNLLRQEVETPPAVVIDDAQPEQPAQQNDFYAKSTGLMSLAMVLLSLAMELGAGLAMRKAWAKAPHDAGLWQRLQQELETIQRQMIAIGGQVTRLEVQPAIFEAQFWSDFYKSMLTHTLRSAMTKLLILAVAIVLVPFAHAAGRSRLNLVIALDLTKSTDVKGPDGKTEFQKNVDGVTGVLAQVPAGAHITVIGITDRSFAQPYILLSASVPEDPGYFGERLSVSQTTLVTAWKRRNAKLKPVFNATDIFGALILAGQIFGQQPASDKRVLVIFSDMRNHTDQLDLESARGPTAASNSEQSKLNLRGAYITILGVDGAGSTSLDWQRLEQFWGANLQSNGAIVETFSALRKMSLLAMK